jgi:hypothetical protein
MKQEMHVLGIDITDTGKVVLRKRLSRHDLMS